MKVTLNGVGSLIDATTAQSTINANNQTIENAFNNTLSLDGTQPNAMQSEFDMNSHQILNLPAPATANSPLRLQDLTNFNGGGTVSNIPAGGTTGQVLSKNSNTNYDTGWTNSVTSVGLALPADLTVTNSPVTTLGTLTGAWAVTPTGTGAMVRAVAPTITGHPTLEGVTSTGATGTGNIVFATSPSLTTPNIGAATATTVNKVTVTAPATSATLTLTDGTVVTGPAATGTLVTKTSTDTLTNKTYDTAGAGNSFSINGVAATANTGTGSVVRATSPTLVTPALGTPTALVLTSATGLPLTGLTTQAAYTIVANATGSAAIPTAMDVTALTSKPSPISADIVLIQDSAASNAFKKTTVGALATAGSVASYEGRTGAVTAQASDRINLYAAPLDAVSYNGMQVNGSCDISQELGTTGATLVSTVKKYVADCFWSQYTGATGVLTSAQILSSAPSGTAVVGFPNAVNLKATTKMAVQGSQSDGDFACITQPIEGYRIARLGMGAASPNSFSIGVWWYSTNAGTTFFRVSNVASGAGRYYYQEVVLAAGWNYVTATIPGDTTGTWAQTSGLGLVIKFFGAGKNTVPVATTAGVATWSATEKVQTTNSTAMLSTTNNDQIAITGLIVVPGSDLPSSSRSPLIMRPFDQEFLVAQRYSRLTAVGSGVAFATTDVSMIIPCVGMRSLPTPTAPTILQITDIYATNPAQSSANASGSGGNLNCVSATLSNFTGLTVGRFYTFYQSPATPVFLDARL